MWLVEAHRDRHGDEHGRHGHEVLVRQNEENVVGIDATVLWRESWDAYDGGRFGRGGKVIARNDCRCDDAQHNIGSFHDRSLLVDLLACEPSDGSRGCFRGAEGWDCKVQTLWRTDVWLWSDVFGDLGAKSIQESGARGAHTDHVSKSCLQLCGQEGCGKCNPQLTGCTAEVCNAQFDTLCCTRALVEVETTLLTHLDLPSHTSLTCSKQNFLFQDADFFLYWFCHSNKFNVFEVS